MTVTFSPSGVVMESTDRTGAFGPWEDLNLAEAGKRRPRGHWGRHGLWRREWIAGKLRQLDRLLLRVDGWQACHAGEDTGG